MAFKWNGHGIFFSPQIRAIASPPKEPPSSSFHVEPVDVDSSSSTLYSEQTGQHPVASCSRTWDVEGTINIRHYRRGSVHGDKTER
jgi:hypothetical protein